jgi:hypothetical protein
LRGCFVLVVAGYDESISGNPRYSMVGDSASGVFNLRIINASLDDDADFECQVGPEKKHKPIRAAAKLTVIGKSRCRRRSVSLSCAALPPIVKQPGPIKIEFAPGIILRSLTPGRARVCHLHLSLSFEYN